MNDKTELLWRFYQEHCNWERHHESQRALATNLVLFIAAGVLSVITIDKSIGVSDLPLTVFLMVLGVFGATLSRKQYERFARHQSLANEYRKAIDQELPEAEVLVIRNRAEDEHAPKYRIFYKSRLNWLWIGLPVVVAMTGVVLTLVIILG